ncbi:MAG: hypothetical protein KKB51_19325 [Candidatus Riflebacteria bacterium]|nr:hypothetical protein [Candidatus Riflebacteria bacterium]
MRGFSIGFVLAGLILTSTTNVDAQRAFTGREMNERINALRNKLQNYQVEHVRKEPEKVALVKENETVEIKFEKLVEEFESRTDVAVTVLFHDPDFGQSSAKNESPNDSRQVKEPALIAQAPIKNATQPLDVERTLRLEKYEELRRKVQLATRRTHANAQQINSMIAQVP